MLRDVSLQCALSRKISAKQCQHVGTACTRLFQRSIAKCAILRCCFVAFVGEEASERLLVLLLVQDLVLPYKLKPLQERQQRRTGLEIARRGCSSYIPMKIRQEPQLAAARAGQACTMFLLDAAAALSYRAPAGSCKQKLVCSALL